MLLGGSQFTLFGTREVMGKGRVYVYPFDLWFKKIKEPWLSPWTGGSLKKSKHWVKDPTLNGHFFVGFFLENRWFFDFL